MPPPFHPYGDLLLLVVPTALYVAGYKSPTPPLKRQERRNITGVIESDIRLQFFALILSLPALLLTTSEVIIRIAQHIAPSLVYRIAPSLFVLEGGQASNLRFTPLRYLGLAMMLSGSIIRLMAFRKLGKFFTFHVGIQKDHQLVTSFPYSIVRHPSYGAMCVAQPSVVILHWAPGSWLYESGVLFSWPGAVIFGGYGLFLFYHSTFILRTRVLQEDRMLREHFGKQWENWAKDVKYLFLPGIY
ncbi:hypothetical protein CVT24_007591 [Panaeolus cyanescens]|uniref:Protein-S-isoprenylcysteine O-methyltransferase n=1 Tax=Panaeolus cyanescens TaxID=181874 RepID=A0A409YKP9_9AGAR|nr:hypothetical protein CVT24_007591 [Panaeolus cyanescens]